MAFKESDCDIGEEVFVFPASFAQQRLWFLDQLVPGRSLYSVPTVFRLTGTLNHLALEHSFNEIVRRHEALRTSFDVLEGELVQVIAPSLMVPLPVASVQEVPAIDQETKALSLIWAEIERPFDLFKSPLLRLLLVRLDETNHILLINLHHIVFDEWSSGVLIRELSVFYTAYVANQPTLLPELPIQYADFTHWQHEWLKGEVLKSQLGYWRQQLQNLPVLDLPTDHPRPIRQSYRGAIQLLELPQHLLEALENLSQQEGVTLFMTLLAAFQTLLYRYTGQEDLVVGSPIANRSRSELEGLIGFFVNSLVFRTKLSGDITVRELLNRVRETALGAYAHQDLPFEKIVEELHPERDLSRNPLFQVTFALQNTPMEQLELPGLTLSPLEFKTKTTRFDLELYLWTCSDNFRTLWGNNWQQSEGLRGIVVYNTDLFEPDTIARLRQHFQTLLESMVANPDARLADLTLLTAAELEQLLVNTTQRERPYSCVHRLFEAQTIQTPAAIAVRFEAQQFTYQELNRGSNQLAHYLKRFGVGPDVLVGLYLERSSLAIAGMLGILKAGGAYVPLDLTHPIERLHVMLDDAQVRVILTHHQIAEQLGDCDATIICLDQDWETIAQESEENLTSETTPDHLAYVIYTSGSTGTPKGVAIPHRAIDRLVRQTDYIALTPGDRIAQVSNLAFDAATFEIWGALLNGAQLIGIDRNVTLSPVDFATQLQQQQITVLFLTTALFNQMVDHAPTAFGSLRYLLFGGEIADPKKVRTVLKHSPPQHLLHVYGPTENTTFTSWYYVQDVPETATSVPIGRAIANTQIYLLDTYLNPVPLGVTGEIYIGGAGLAREYLNRSELTAEKFVLKAEAERQKDEGGRMKTEAKRSPIPHPPSPPSPLSSPPPPPPSSFLPPPSSFLYKTGDLARYRSDGNLEFLGRIDDQVKLRGFRIELGEIETILNQHPAIREAVVVVREIEGDRRLIAYISQQVPSLNTRDLRYFLQSKLPDYMLPSAFVVLNSLPLTPNGKIDRRALPLVSIKAEATVTDATPRTSVETVLSELWSKLLGLKQVSVYDNFFELGGHSLLATQLVSRIRNTFHIEVPLQRLFETPTIAGLAQYIETVLWAATELSTPHATAPHAAIDDAGEGMPSLSRSTQESHNREEVEL